MGKNVLEKLVRRRVGCRTLHSALDTDPQSEIGTFLGGVQAFLDFKRLLERTFFAEVDLLDEFR